ncbi:unnamed protein product [Leuciscus chuanchicus]
MDVQAGAVKGQNLIQVWTRDIVNHFWYCSKQASTEEQFKLMWVGVMHHVRNEHFWATGCCQHEPLEEGSQDKLWMEQGRKDRTITNPKNWAVYTVKEKKEYKYIPDLQKAILGRRLKSGLPRKTTLRADDPRRLGLLSSAQPPPPTSELVQKHVSQGDTAPALH